MLEKKLKILHAPVNIGNQPWALSRGEQLLGCESKVVITNNNWTQYPYDLSLSDFRKFSMVSRVRRFAYAMLSPLRFDILHYYFGKTLIGSGSCGPRGGRDYLDLKFAKKLGRKVFMTLQGCDVRMAVESEKNNKFTPCKENRCGFYQRCIVEQDDNRRWFINNILPHADKIFFLNPELGHYLNRGSFLPYATVDVENLSAIRSKNSRILKIVHAPSDPLIKGTNLILDALDKLKTKYQFELVLVKNKTHAEAMEIYKQADLAIDQVLCGWYGAFAVEMMAMGVPVLCYIRDEDLKFIPTEMAKELPILKIHPDRLVEDIAAVLDARDKWKNWSLSSRQFTLRWHNPRIIAQAMVEAYRSSSSNFNISKFIEE